MKENRRRFLRNLSLGGAGISAGLPLLANRSYSNDGYPNYIQHERKSGPNDFNMCGYAAPKLNTVRIGIIGLGMRGPDAVKRMSFIEGVQIVALCDKFPERVNSAQQKRRPWPAGCKLPPCLRSQTLAGGGQPCCSG